MSKNWPMRVELVVVERTHAADRKPAGARGEHQQQQTGQDLGNRQPDERDERQRPIDPRVLPHRRQHPERDGQPPGDERRRDGEQQRVGEPFAEHVEHRLMARERLAEVEVQDDVLQVEAVLHVPRLVEAEPHAHRLDRLGGDAGILRHLVQEVAGRELQQEKRDERDAEQQRDRLQQAPQDVGAHGSRR